MALKKSKVVSTTKKGYKRKSSVKKSVKRSKSIKSKRSVKFRTI